MAILNYNILKQKDYATDRFNEHVDRFSLIADMIEASSIDEAKLKEIEEIDNCFPEIDYRVYQSIEEGVIPQQEKETCTVVYIELKTIKIV